MSIARFWAMRIRSALIAIAVTTATAAAEPASPPRPQRSRIAVLVGPALRVAWQRNSNADPETLTHATYSFVATVAYRIDPRFAVGVHATVANSTSGHDEELGNTSGYVRDWSAMPADVALAASYRRAHITVTPWIGRHVTRLDERSSEYHHVVGGTAHTDVHHTTWSNDFTSFGITLDLATRGGTPDVPVALVLDLQTGLGSSPSTYDEDRRYTSLSVGIAGTL